MTNSCADEIWLPVLGYEANYEVSNWGRVRSHFTYWRLGDPIRYLKPKAVGAGYLGVSLYRDRKPTTKAIHRLVAAAFLGTEAEINHADGDKTNNKVSNLTPCSHRENQQHAFATGLMQAPPRKVGEANGRAEVGEEMVLLIRRRLDEGESATDVSADLGVSRNTVYNIKYRRKWKHLLAPPLPQAA